MMMVNKCTWKIVLSIAGLLLAGTAGATEIVGKFGGEKPVKPRDYGIHLIDSEGYTEQWCHEVWVEDGSFIGTDFMVSNLGIGDHKGAIRFTYIDQKRKKSTCTAKIDSDDWKAAKEGFSLKFGKSTAKGDAEAIHIKMRCKKRSLDLVFTNQSPPLKPGGGVLRFGDDGKYSMVFTSPRASVSGSVTVKGKTMEIRGVGHATHSYSTMYPHKQARRWFRFKALREDISIILAEMEATRYYGSAHNGWALAIDSTGRILATARVNFKFDGYIADKKSAEGYAIPRRVKLVAADGENSMVGVLLMKNIKSIHDPTEDLDAISRAFVRRFTKPKEYHINCSYRFRIKDKKNDNKEHMIEGEGTYKFVFVNP
jgi:hypothetical protein